MPDMILHIPPDIQRPCPFIQRLSEGSICYCRKPSSIIARLIRIPINKKKSRTYHCYMQEAEEHTKSQAYV